MSRLRISKIIIGLLWIGLMILGVISNFAILLIILFVSSLIFGPFFCGWLCPFGFVQSIFNKLAIKASIPQLKIPMYLHNVLKVIKYILFIALLLPIARYLIVIFTYDPRNNLDYILKNETLSIIAISIMALFLFISLFNNRFFCKYLCVEGAKYSLFSFGRIFNIKRTDACVNCGMCSKACPMQIDIEKNQEVKNLTCINCMDCISACNVKGAIKYTFSFNSKKMIATILAVILLICYMIYSYNPMIISNLLKNLGFTGMATSYVVTENQQVLTGTANGFKSEISVDVIMDGEEIKYIEVTDQQDDMPWYLQSLSVIDEMIEKQSTDIDAVSGATCTSQGIINATKDALDLEFVEQELTEDHGGKGHGRKGAGKQR